MKQEWCRIMEKSKISGIFNLAGTHSVGLVSWRSSSWLGTCGFRPSALHLKPFSLVNNMQINPHRTHELARRWSALAVTSLIYQVQFGDYWERLRCWRIFPATNGGMQGNDQRWGSGAGVELLCWKRTRIHHIFVMLMVINFLYAQGYFKREKISSVNSWKYLSKIPTDDPLPVLKMVMTKVYMKYWNFTWSVYEVLNANR